MKSFTKFITATVIAFGFSLAATQGEDIKPESKKPHPTPAANADLLEGSLYAFDTVWTNQDGEKVPWKTSAKGKARVLAMGYSTCQGICPRIIADMQRLEKKLTPEEKKATAFTFLSLAPEIDTVPFLKEFTKNHHLGDSWQVMRGSPDAVLELAVALGIQFAKIAGTPEYSHSYLIAILDSDGRLVHKWISPDTSPDVALAALRKHLPPAKGNVEKTPATSNPVEAAPQK